MLRDSSAGYRTAKPKNPEVNTPEGPRRDFHAALGCAGPRLTVACRSDCQLAAWRRFQQFVRRYEPERHADRVARSSGVRLLF